MEPIRRIATLSAAASLLLASCGRNDTTISPSPASPSPTVAPEATASPFATGTTRMSPSPMATPAPAIPANPIPGEPERPSATATPMP